MWHHCIKMEFKKIVNFLDAIPDDNDLPRFVTKKWIEVCEMEIKMLIKKLESKHQC